MTLFQIKEIPLTDITITDRSRKTFEDIEELAESIESQGLLYPILITEDNILLEGERRYRAFKHLNRSAIPCRILTGIDPSDRELIEFIGNHQRKAFLWHEDLALKQKMHTKWKSENEKWGYRQTAAKLRVSLGGLSTDLEMANIIQTFPTLKECDTKGKAREAYKKMIGQAEAIKAMSSMPNEDKDRLAGLLTGGSGSSSGGGNQQDGGKQARQDDKKISGGQPTNDEPTPTESPVSSVPKHAYHVCLWPELLPQIPDNSVGFCELDPPYAMDFDDLGIYANEGLKEADWSEDHYKDQMTKLLTDLYPKMIDRSWVLCWVAHRFAKWTNETAISAGFKIQPTVGIWSKPGGSSIRPNSVLVSNYESFLLFGKGDAVFNTKSLLAAIHQSTSSFANKVHQWEKPLDLYRIFFEALGKPSTIFLSPFAGSGNSMIVAAQQKMIPIGCDKEAKYMYSFEKNFNNFFLGE